MPDERMPGEAVPVTIGGKAHRLHYSNRAQFRLKEAAGLTIAQALVQAGAMDAHALTYLVWAGRLHAEPDLEVETVIDEIDPGEYTEILKQVMVAVRQAMPWMGTPGKKKPGGSSAGSRRGRKPGR